jgi:hypothetical protein
MIPTADSRNSASAAPARWKRWRLPQILSILATLLWAFGVGAGIERVWRYESTPGVAKSGPQLWPGSKLIQTRPGRPTLVMFVHPHCPCSRASLAELREIMLRSPEGLTASILFLRPHGAMDTWESTSTWRSAQGIPGLSVHVDRDGSEAARFGASTSGHTVLYGVDGHLLFSGGITAARGHVGDNSGRQAVLALLDVEHSVTRDHAVYGCSLHDSNTAQSGS